MNLSYAQGCVAIRGNGACGGSMSNLIELSKSEITVFSSFRYFKSFRHFRGDVEEHDRILNGTQVINISSFLDLGISYGISNRVFLTSVLPIVFHIRSSMYEHGGNPPNGLGDRNETSSSGLSDLRFSINYWLLEPGSKNYNYSLGFGVKLPTGDSNYKADFYNQGPDKNETLKSVVDQSIQPGDGGFGLTLDLQTYHLINNHFGINGSLYYLFNIEETNGILTRSGSSEFSCPDQYALRIGSFYNFDNGFNLYLGSRLEGVPAEDLIGGSSGYRRPGYAVSIEPGIGYNVNNVSVNLSFPFAMYRNRTQSVSDKERTISTGVYRHGDAAFADYLINFSVGYRFAKAGNHGDMEVKEVFKNI